MSVEAWHTFDSPREECDTHGEDDTVLSLKINA